MQIINQKKRLKRSYYRRLKIILIAIQYNNKSSDAHEKLGIIYHYKGQEIEAIKHYANALENTEDM